jgi:hypothetical protein
MHPDSQPHPSPVRGFLRSVRELPLLCQGRPDILKTWLENPAGVRLLACLAAILAGCGLYGFTLGLWRAPLMGACVAAKLPLLILLTLLTNGLLNGMLALLLGSGLGFRQTMLAMLMSFASFSLITGALSPVALMMVLDAPAPGEPGSGEAYRVILLTHTAIIAFAGVIAHRRFFPVLAATSESRAAAPRVFLAWLAGNLFVGAQISWYMRPFFGQPGKEIQFFRTDWNRSSFYESVYFNLKTLIAPALQPAGIMVLLALCLFSFGAFLIVRSVRKVLRASSLRNSRP